MNSDRRDPHTPNRARLQLAVATFLGCLAMLLAVIPAATARTDTATTQTAAGEAAGESSTTVEGAGGEAEAATGTAPTADEGTSAATTTRTKGAGRERLRNKKAAAKTEAATTQTTGAGAETDAAAQGKKPVEKPVKHKSPKAKEKAREEREVKTAERELRRIEKGKPPKTSGKTKPETTEPVSKSGSTTPTATTAASAGAVATAASADPAATTPTSGTTAPTIESARPQGKSASKRRGAHRGRTGANTSALEAAPAATAALATGALAVNRETAAHAAHRPSPTRPPGTRQSPIVTTITRIVDVVPLAARLLIAGLLALALALAVRTGIVALRARRLERQRSELLEDVGLLQAALLPAPPERLGPVGTSVAYRPAAGPGAGGDFYDVFALEDGEIAVIVGDISGHGRQALPHTALVRFTLRAYLEAGMSPREALETAGNVLEHQLGGSFATVLAATYNPRERMLVYACAGHPRPLVVGEGGAHATGTTACSAPPIGVGLRTGTRQTVVAVPGGAQACFFTDGVVEARVGDELFGTERLTDALTELGAGVSASDLLDRVAEDTDRRPDDMAACLLAIDGGGAAPSVIVEELELDHEELQSDRPEHLLLAHGIPPEEIARFITSARVEVGEHGAATLLLRLGDGRPRLSLRRDNVVLMRQPAFSRGPRARMSL